MITVSEAEVLARVAHGGDRTRSGGLFIDHVRRVAQRLSNDRDDYAVVAALLHDTVEKGSFEWADLHAAGADQRLIEVVDALTERDWEPSEMYLARCAADPLARRIKRADIADKLDSGNFVGLSDASAMAIRARARKRLALLDALIQRVGSQPQTFTPHPCPDGVGFLFMQANVNKNSSSATMWSEAMTCATTRVN